MTLDSSTSGGASEASSLERHAYKKSTLRLVPILAVGFIIAYLDRVNISFAQSQMQDTLSLSPAAYGFGAGIFFIGYFVFEIPSNFMLSRVGARAWLSTILILWGALSSLTMLVQNEFWFYLVRFCIGAAEAGFMPGVMLFFTFWFPARKRAQINSLFLTAVPLSSVLGGPIAGAILTYFADGPLLHGWQWLFLLEGGLAVLCGILLPSILTDKPEHATWLSAAQREALVRNLEAEESESHEHDFKKALRQSATIFLAAVYFFALIGQWGLAFWLPQIIAQTGIRSELSIGLLSAIPFLLAAIAMVMVGKHSDRTGDRQKHIGSALMLSSFGFIFTGLFAHNTVLSILALTLAAVGVNVFFPLHWTLPPKALAGPALAAGIALVNAVGNLSGFASPYMIGLIKQSTGRTDMGMYVVAACVMLAAILVLFFLPRKLAIRDRYCTDETSPTHSLASSTHQA